MSPSCLEAKKVQTHSSRVILCSEALASGVSRVSFRIKNLQSWIAVGIGILPRVKEKGFCLESKDGVTQAAPSATGRTWSPTTE